jgi:hypothetical protein
MRRLYDWWNWVTLRSASYSSLSAARAHFCTTPIPSVNTEGAQVKMGSILSSCSHQPVSPPRRWDEVSVFPPPSGNRNAPHLNAPRSINTNTAVFRDVNPHVESTAPHSGATLSSTSTDLIIGIDFGTTYTGVAYAYATEAGPVKSTVEMRKAADKVTVIKNWPNQGNSYAVKTPSVLSYAGRPPRWGGSVKPRDEPQVAYFKLGLQEDRTASNFRRQDSDTFDENESALGGFLSNPAWTHPSLPLMTPLDYTRDYLTAVNRYVKEEVLPTRFGEIFLQNQKLSYVLTVPAIWSDKAKQLTRQAALAAGIESDRLTLITEPEAAALYCATLCEEVDIEAGDRFMICDAGGGTVVFPQ